MSETRIAVLGGGNGAHALAGHLALEGYEVSMYEMPRFADEIETVFETESIRLTGEVEGSGELAEVTSDIDAAVADAEFVCLVVPAFAHEDYAEILSGVLTESQTLLLVPGTLGSLSMREAFRENGDPVPTIAETDTLPYDARIVEDGVVRVLAENPVNIGVLPAGETESFLESIPDFFDFEQVYNDVLESGLSSVNPALHSGACVINAGPIEYWANGDFYLYEEGFTPSAAKLDKQLDEERNEIGRQLDYELTTFEDFVGVEPGWEWDDLYREIHGHIGLTPIEGPNDIHNRYLTEDAPYGLVPWSTIGDELGVETPIMDAIVNIYSVIHETDWWEAGRTAEELGLDGMNAAEMRDAVQ
jgi:opine dehydrogenase